MPDEYAAIAKNANRIVQQFDHDFGTTWESSIQPSLQSIVLRQGSLTFRIERNGLYGLLGVRDRITENNGQADPNALVDFDIPLTIQTRGTRLKLVLRDNDDSPRKPDPALVKAIARAHYWIDRLTTGEASSQQDIAQQENLPSSYITRVLRLATLAPDIIETILDGRQPYQLTSTRLLHDQDLPMSWERQRERFSGHG